MQPKLINLLEAEAIIEAHKDKPEQKVVICYNKKWYDIRGMTEQEIQLFANKLVQGKIMDNASPTPAEAQQGQAPAPVTGGVVTPTPIMIKGMSFAAAMDHIIKGEKITKLEWKNPNIFAHLNNGMLQLHNPKNDNWAVSEADMLGLDYVVID